MLYLLNQNSSTTMTFWLSHLMCINHITLAANAKTRITCTLLVSPWLDPFSFVMMKKKTGNYFFSPPHRGWFPVMSKSCGLVVLKWSCEQKDEGNTRHPFQHLLFFSHTHKVSIDWGVPGLIVPLLQWLAFSPCVTKPSLALIKVWWNQCYISVSSQISCACGDVGWNSTASVRMWLLHSLYMLIKRERQSERERKAHCARGTIRRAAPIEKDWSRLLSTVYISATEGAHTACFVPIRWPTWKTHTHAEIHIQTHTVSKTHLCQNLDFRAGQPADLKGQLALISKIYSCWCSAATEGAFLQRQ